MKHYLQDVGSTFGMANNPHEYGHGVGAFLRTGAEPPPPLFRSASR